MATQIFRVTLDYVRGAGGIDSTKLPLNGSQSMLANLPFGGFRGVDLASPINDSDADTKGARDTAVAAEAAARDSAIDSATASIETWTTNQINTALFQSSIPTVSSLAAIKSLSSSTAPTFIVDTVRGFLWSKRPANELTPDDDIVIQATDNSCQYVFAGLCVYSQKWRTQASWYVDGTSGNDWNDGTDSHPLATYSEVQRRCGGPGFILTNVVDVYFVTAPKDNSVLIEFDRRNVDHNIRLIDASTRTILASGTLTTYAVPSSTNNEVTVISVTGISDWTALVNKRVNFGAQGTARVCAANPGGMGVQYARITLPKKAPADRYSSPLTGAPTIGQSVTVESLGIDLSLVGIRFKGSGSKTSAGVNRQALWMLGLVASNGVDIGANYDFSVRTWDCDLRDVACLPQVVFQYGGSTSSTIVHIRAILAGVLINTANNGSNSLICHSAGGSAMLQDVVMEGVSVVIYDAACAVNSVGIFDSPTYGMTVHNGGFLYLSGLMLGKNNAGFGLVVTGCGQVKLSGATLKLTGASGDWQGDGNKFTWAATSTRKFDHGVLVGAFTNGVAIMTAENIPSDAVFQPFYRTKHGVPAGVLDYPTVVTSNGITTVTLTSPNGSSDTSDVGVTWISPAAGFGGIS